MADKPKLIADFYKQISLDAEKQTALADHFTTEVARARADRTVLEERWRRAIDLFEGNRDEKNFPWPGAANNHLPLVASTVAALHARFMTTLFAPEPFWRIRSRNPEFQELMKQATEYMDWSRQNEFPWYDTVRDWSLDAIKLGFGVMKVTYRKRIGKELHYDEKYQIVEEERVLEDRPHTESIPPEDFLWPAGFFNIQTCPWLCHVLHYTAGGLRQAAAEGTFRKDAVQKIVSGVANTTTDNTVTQEREEAEGITPTDRQVYDLYEIWGLYDVNGDGLEEEIQAVIDPQTNIVLRLNLNPYFHRKRPFVIGRLEVREHAIAGLGVSDIIGDQNEELNQIHNQTVDATTASIVQMYGVRIGSPAYDAMDKVWPSKKVPVTAKDDVFEIGLGPLKSMGSFQLSAEVRQDAERRSGISDFSYGREPGSGTRRGTATGTLAIIQEGNKKFDFQIKDMREALGEAGLMVFSLLQQMNPEGLSREVLGADGAVFTRLTLNFPQTPVHRAASVEAVAGTSTINRQVQRQDAITLYQIFTSVAQQAIQLGMMLSQPGLPPPMLRLGVQIGHATEVLLTAVLDGFENRQADELIPDLEEIYQQLGILNIQQTAFMQQAQALGLQTGGPGGSPTGQPDQGAGGAAQAAPQRPGMGAPSGPASRS